MKRTMCFMALALALMLATPVVAQNTTGIDWERGPFHDAEFWRWPTGIGSKWHQQVEELLGAGVGLGTGDMYYADSNVSIEGSGDSWKNAKDTIDEAINLCTASNGDVILVAQGHAESWTAADGFDADLAGITIVFCGNSQDQGTLTFADTDATVAIGAANVTIYGGRFLAGISEVVSGIIGEAGGDNFRLIGATFPEPTTSTFEFDETITVASGADGVLIAGCVGYSADDSGASSFLDLTAGSITGRESWAIPW